MAKRRSAKEGSIYQRSDGRWAGAVSIGGRKRKAFYGRTQEEVREKILKARHDLSQGLPMNDDRLTFSRYLDKWLEDSVKPSVRPRTHESYSQYVRLYIRPALGSIKLTKLGPADIQSLLNQQQEKGLSARTAQYTHAVIRRALEQAYQWQLVPRNVAKLVRPPRVQRQEAKALTPEQARIFLEAVSGDRLEAFYTVAIALGLRRGECLALKWEDIDFENETLRVRHTLHRHKGGGWTLVEPKSRNSRRTIALPKVIVQSLKDHKKRQLEERIFQGSRWQETGFVFTSTIGTPLCGDNVFKRFRDILKKAGLPGINLHGLRHTAASLLLVQGVSARVVMETLGHSQISLTMNTYSHVMPVLMREAADKMDSILGGN
ncbi:MAG: site-specific integrase [Candidatus Desulforudis sp.]|nr:site-specific integrase [Desulforudis sp.]